MSNYWTYTYVSEVWAAKEACSLAAKLADAICAQTLAEHRSIFEYDHMSYKIAHQAWRGGFRQAAADVWVAIRYSKDSDYKTVADYCAEREEYQRRFDCQDPHNKGTMAAVKILREFLIMFPENHATQNK